MQQLRVKLCLLFRKEFLAEEIFQNLDLLRQSEWSDVLNCFDAQECYSLFFKKLSVMYNMCFPVKEFTTCYKNQKPWLTDGIKNAIKKKNQLWA